MSIKVTTEPVLPPECDGSCLDCMSLGDYGKSRTVQSHRESCDIPSIVAKYRRTGQLPSIRANVQQLAQYGDFTDVPTFQDAQDRIIAAHAAFDSLPAKIRERFANDPVALLTFLADPANRSEAISLGLIDQPVDVQQVAKVEPPKAGTEPAAA